MCHSLFQGVEIHELSQKGDLILGHLIWELSLATFLS